MIPSFSHNHYYTWVSMLSVFSMSRKAVYTYTTCPQWEQRRGTCSCSSMTVDCKSYSTVFKPPPPPSARLTDANCGTGIVVLWSWVFPQLGWSSLVAVMSKLKLTSGRRQKWGAGSNWLTLSFQCSSVFSLCFMPQVLIHTASDTSPLPRSSLVICKFKAEITFYLPFLNPA